MEGDGATTAAKIEHITKASSDELLSKFAQVSSQSNNNKLALTLVKKKKKKDLRLSTKRQKINRAKPDRTNCDSPLNNCVADMKSLLPPAANRRSNALIGKAKVRTRNLKNKSLLGTIQKTWRKTVEGASKIFIEKHYNRHKRLISDVA